MWKTGPWPLALCLVTGLLDGCAREPVEDQSDLLHSENSQVRRPGESYEEAESRYRRGLSKVRLASYMNHHSVKSLAAPFGQAKRDVIPEWDTEASLQEGFEAIRDRRFLRDKKHSMMRRSTWLYPDNGCYARAQLMSYNLQTLGYPSPAKIFVFGKLTVETAYAPGGVIRWWYHTAPVVKRDGTVHVLDPAVEPDTALTLDEWKAEITGGGELTVSFCRPEAYGPYSQCRVGTKSRLDKAFADQKDLLDKEWQRLLDLGRKPREELGDSPPWK